MILKYDLRLILLKKTSFQVKCVLVNIFGGIVNCATIANGVVNACRKINLQVPLVVRLEGLFLTNYPS